MTKNFLVFLIMIPLGFCREASAQQTNNAKYKDIEFDYDGESVNVSISLNLRAYYVEVGTFLTLTPLIRTATDTLELPGVILSGQGRLSFYLLDSNSLDMNLYKNVITDAVIPQNRLYRVKVPYLLWMGGARLEMKIELSRDGESPLYSYTEALKSSIKVKVPKGWRFLPVSKQEPLRIKMQ